MKNTTDKSRVNENKLNAQKYLDEYDLEVVVSEIINSLVHEKDKHPYVYMIKYLAGLMTEEEREQFNLEIPGPYPVGRPAVRFPKFDSSSNNLLKINLTKDKWDQLKHLKTKHGNNINALTKLSNNKPLDPIGCILVDGDCINVYSSILRNIISSIHQIPSDSSALKEYRINQFDSINQNDLPLGSGDIINKAGKIVLSFSRNISDFPFNHFSSGTNKISSVEALLIKAVNTLQSDNIIPECNQYAVKDNRNEIDSLLNYINFDIDWFNSAGLNQCWPDCRTIFATSDKSLIILINFADHIQICLSNKKGKIDISQMNEKGIEILKQIASMASFEASKQFGFLTSHINLIGAGFKMSSLIDIEQLTEHKFDNDITIHDILQGLNFDKYSIENGQLYSSQSCKLSYNNDKDFIINYSSKICGLIQLNSNEEVRGEISFKQLPIENNDILKSIYEKCFNEMKYLLSVKGQNINSLVKYTSFFPNNQSGIIIHDLSDYNVFFPLIQQYVLLSQHFNPIKTDHIHKPDEPKQMIDISEEDLEKITDVTICLMRNIEGRQLPHCKSNSNSLVEETIKHTIDTLNHKGHFANYFSYADNNANEQVNQLITDNNLSFYHNDNMMQFSIDQDYPLNRGVIQFAKDNLFAIVNDMDHIRFILHIKQLKDKFSFSLVNLLKVVNEFSKHIVFSYNIKLGFLTTNPRYLGTGLDIKLHITLKNLSKDALEEYLKEKDDKNFECSFIETGNEGKPYQVEVRNKITIGLSETELLTNLLSYLNDILLKDK